MNESRPRVLPLLLLVLLVAMLYGTFGCAHVDTGKACPGPTARQVMSEKGVVADCWYDQDEQTYERVTRCFVLYDGDDQVRIRRVWRQHCGL